MSISATRETVIVIAVTLAVFIANSSPPLLVGVGHHYPSISAASIWAGVVTDSAGFSSIPPSLSSSFSSALYAIAGMEDLTLDSGLGSVMISLVAMGGLWAVWMGSRRLSRASEAGPLLWTGTTVFFIATVLGLLSLQPNHSAQARILKWT